MTGGEAESLGKGRVWSGARSVLTGRGAAPRSIQYCCWILSLLLTTRRRARINMGEGGGQ